MGARPPTGPAMGNGYSGPLGLNGHPGYNGPPMIGGMGHMPPQHNNPYGGPPRPPPMGGPMGMSGGFPPNQPRTQPPPAPFGLRTAAPRPPFALAGNNGAPPGFPGRVPYQQQPVPDLQNGTGMKRSQPPFDFGRDPKRPRGSDNLDSLPY
jgi:hypothetical protein